MPWSATCKRESQQSQWCRFQAESAGLGMRISDDPRLTSQLGGQAEGDSVFLYFLFHPDPQGIEWCSFTLRRVTCSTQFYQFKYSFFLETPLQIHTEVIFNHLSGHPGAQESWHIKLTVTSNLKKKKSIYFLMLGNFHCSQSPMWIEVKVGFFPPLLSIHFSLLFHFIDIFSTLIKRGQFISFLKYLVFKSFSTSKWGRSHKLNLKLQK